MCTLVPSPFLNFGTANWHAGLSSLGVNLLCLTSDGLSSNLVRLAQLVGLVEFVNQFFNITNLERSQIGVSVVIFVSFFTCRS